MTPVLPLQSMCSVNSLYSGMSRADLDLGFTERVTAEETEADFSTWPDVLTARLNFQLGFSDSVE